MLQVKNICGGYGTTPILKDISFQVEKGTFLGILGPNGCGKSTLLKIISGVLKPSLGKILIDDKELATYSNRELAKTMTVLPQLHGAAFSSTVRETVSIGRYPHQKGFFSQWSEEDEYAVNQAMVQTGVKRYENAYLENLSGGERQRVFIAQALAQSSQLILLDEPTNHLDIAHQQQILDMIRKEVTDNGLTVVSVLHDINLAALYCDELLLMEKGQVRAFGKPHEVLLENQIADVYGAQISLQAHPEQPKPQITILPEIHEPLKDGKITLNHIQIQEEYVELRSQFPLRVLSSAVHNAGLGWYENFINRTVKPEYNIENVQEEYTQYLYKAGFSPTNTVGMMTAVEARKAIIKQYETPFGEVYVIVTAGIGGAIDVSKTYEREFPIRIGTINIWVIMNAKLSDEAFVQAMITATEAKTKALQHERVMDYQTNTIATGTPTDSLLIAATQTGDYMQYGGPITPVGKIVGRGVFEATTEAIRNYQKGE
ncbi:iron complex transport system ATP-binding protein [Ureibacillus xyleni]|uniref:Iron complex transport system ATP-binding protein n=1 Tax=Ureibacillus xyleni TaxID=614648 RepID=A0A285R6Z9_9BACL|nr:adenosylcobinamide amidohydrolase [Ureibacillus xyleni]SOB89851.1 iron complex transport system ATP-binding protein [Ureibacillus xyleni]